MAAGDVYRVTLKQQYTDGGIAVQHVLWFERTDEDSVDGVTEAIADAVASAWVGSLTGTKPWSYLHTPQFAFIGTEAQRMYPTASAPASVGVAGPVIGVGTDGESGIPSVCCLVVVLRTDDGGRRGRGRLYLGGYPGRVPNNPGFWADYGTLVNHSQWNGALMTDETARLTHLLDDKFDGATDLGGGLMLRWGIFSRKDAGAQVPPFPSNGFKAITNITTDGVVRVQRRREYGHGI